MTIRSWMLFVLFLLLTTAGCSTGGLPANQRPPNNVANAVPSSVATPGKGFTSADIAKLKWVQGSWRGMDGEKPFFERYRIANDSLIVETTDATLSQIEDTSKFELKDGEFGNTVGDRRSAASQITADFVQFVPAPGSPGNSFRFERLEGGKWRAVLEWPATADKPARQKVYLMEPVTASP